NGRGENSRANCSSHWSRLESSASNSITTPSNFDPPRRRSSNSAAERTAIARIPVASSDLKSEREWPFANAIRTDFAIGTLAGFGAAILSFSWGVIGGLQLCDKSLETATLKRERAL